MSLIHVDIDGVLVDGTIDESIAPFAKANGLGFNDGSILWSLHETHVADNPSKLNIPLLKHLSVLRDMGHHLKVWTDRPYTVRARTIDNLGSWAGIFDDFSFNSGKKIFTKDEGVIIDDNLKFEGCGEHFVHYPKFF